MPVSCVEYQGEGIDRLVTMNERYPDIRVRLHSRNPFALVSAVRQALRRSDVDPREITRFTQEALREPEPGRVRHVCASWAAVELVGAAP